MKRADDIPRERIRALDVVSRENIFTGVMVLDCFFFVFSFPPFPAFSHLSIRNTNLAGILFTDRSMHCRNVDAKNGNRVTESKRMIENTRPSFARAIKKYFQEL